MCIFWVFFLAGCLVTCDRDLDDWMEVALGGWRLEKRKVPLCLRVWWLIYVFFGYSHEVVPCAVTV